MSAGCGDCRGLNLTTMPSAGERRNGDNAVDGADNQQLPYPEMLAKLRGIEVSALYQRHLTTKTRMAHHPFQYTLEQFDFAFQTSTDGRLVKDLVDPDFRRRCRQRRDAGSARSRQATLGRQGHREPGYCHSNISSMRWLPQSQKNYQSSGSTSSHPSLTSSFIPCS